jgi:hypothetical protein
VSVSNFIFYSGLNHGPNLKPDDYVFKLFKLKSGPGEFKSEFKSNHEPASGPNLWNQTQAPFRKRSRGQRRKLTPCRTFRDRCVCG